MLIDIVDIVSVFHQIFVHFEVNDITEELIILLIALHHFAAISLPIGINILFVLFLLAHLQLLLICRHGPPEYRLLDDQQSIPVPIPILII